MWQTTAAAALRLMGGTTVAVLARLAGELGRPSAFAYHPAGDGTPGAVAVYRASFRPPAVLSAPYAAVSVAMAVCDEKEEEKKEEEPAQRQSSSVGFSMLSMFRGERFAIPTPDTVAAFRGSARGLASIDAWTDRVMHGTVERVSQHIAALQAAKGAVELVISSSAYSEVQRESIDRLVDVWGCLQRPLDEEIASARALERRRAAPPVAVRQSPAPRPGQRWCASSRDPRAAGTPQQSQSSPIATARPNPSMKPIETCNTHRPWCGTTTRTSIGSAAGDSASASLRRTPTSASSSPGLLPCVHHRRLRRIA